MPRHFLTTEDWSRAEIDALLASAAELKRQPVQPLLRDKTIALVFFNPSLRTRTSFDVGIADATRNQIRDAMREHPITQRALSSYETLRLSDGFLREPCEEDARDETDDETDPG